MDTFQSVYIGGFNQLDEQARLKKRALELYGQTRSRARWQQLRSLVTRRSNRLVTLNATRERTEVTENGSVGSQAVALDQIEGTLSPGRCQDFDAGFRPLKSHIQQRWVNVATAMQLGKQLPEVKLVQLGDTYFVQDGHHRVSVAKALGQATIKAKVTVISPDAARN